MFAVALYARAWVEIYQTIAAPPDPPVALYARAWVEMAEPDNRNLPYTVALYARAWVEMVETLAIPLRTSCRPLREGVGRNFDSIGINFDVVLVALYARAWVEMRNCWR